MAFSFGSSSTPAGAFGAASTPAFGAASAPAFGASTPAFGAAASTPSFAGFGTSTFGTAPTAASGQTAPALAFGQTAPALAFGQTAPAFGQTAAPSAFGGFGQAPASTALTLASPGQQQQQQAQQPISYSTRYDDLPPAGQKELQDIQCVHVHLHRSLFPCGLYSAALSVHDALKQAALRSAA